MSLTYTERQDAIKREAEKFPETFGLRGFPGERFRVSLAASHFAFGGVVLYTQIKGDDGKWRDFAKGTPAELRREVTP